MENLGYGGKSCRRPAELPGGGMPRTSSDKDGDAGTFYALECPGHRGHFG